MLQSLFKGKNASEMLGDVQEKLQDGSLDGVLEKIGVDADKVGSIAGGVGSALEMAEKVLGKGDDAAASGDETAEETAADSDE